MPTITLYEPLNNSTFIPNSSISIGVNFTDCSKINFYVNGGLNNTYQVTMPGAIGMSWNYVPKSTGIYDFYVQAINSSGQSANSSTIRVTVTNINTFITLNEPIHNSTFNMANSSISINTSFSNCNQVKLYVNGVLDITQQVTPGITSMKWLYTPKSTGTHDFYVQAINSSGQSVNSSTNRVTVTNVGVYKYKTSASAQPQIFPSDCTDLYKMINYVIANCPNGTDILNSSNNTIFSKNTTLSGYNYIYDKNDILITNPNRSSNLYTDDECLNIVPLNKYFKTIKPTGLQGISYSKIFYYGGTVSKIYSLQEKNVGGYYTDRTGQDLAYDTVEFDVNLASAATNIAESHNGAYKPIPYVALGVNMRALLDPAYFRGVEFGLQLKLDISDNKYKWWTYYTLNRAIITPATSVSFKVNGKDVTSTTEWSKPSIMPVKINNTYVDKTDAIWTNGVTGTAKLKCTFYKGSDRDYVIMSVIVGSTTYEVEYKMEIGNSNALANLTHDIRKFISLVPSASDNGTPRNIKTDYYFQKVQYSNAKIARKGSSSLENWNYDYSNNLSAGAFNWEFVDANPVGNGNIVSISYKGRNGNDVLQF